MKACPFLLFNGFRAKEGNLSQRDPTLNAMIRRPFYYLTLQASTHAHAHTHAHTFMRGFSSLETFNVITTTTEIFEPPLNIVIYIILR